uniref:Odorant binding protein 8 n=1 Tax=Sirex noctilio TaxID=36765 RepID=A0A857N297_9HYME|nr:odorant binding protein 8 [Sirex noctilio]
MIKEFKELIDQCAAEMDVTEEQLKMMRDKMVNEEDERKIACMKACILQKAGIMVSSKLLKEEIDNLVQKLHFDDDENREKMQKTVSDCYDEVQNLEDECEIAKSFTKCFEHGKSD